MQQQGNKAQRRLLIGWVAIFLAFGSLGVGQAAGAVSNFETVGHFGGPFPPRPEGEPWPEGVQLGGASGMAINRTGAGGVPKGTVYVAVPTQPKDGVNGGTSLQEGVARYSPKGVFEETFTASGRCGPIVLGEPACGSRPNWGSLAMGIGIDQSTGNVYFLRSEPAPGQPRIIVFNPDGTAVISEFGIQGAFGETATEGPSKIHSTVSGGLAVNDAGEVFVFDEDNPSDFFRRVMVFKPAVPGNYENYVYASGEDIGGTPKLSAAGPGRPMLDDDGNVYTASPDFIAKFDLSKSRTTPICTFKSSEIRSAAVDPATGSIFLYSGLDGKIHILEPCNAEGKFTETQPSFTPTPVRSYISALAFDPEGEFSGNAPGVLLGAAWNGSSGEIGEANQSALGYIFSRPPSAEPVVVGESVSNVGTNTATLRAQINPSGSLTRYSFQYLPTASWEANEPSERFVGAAEAPVAGSAVLGSGKEPLLATAVISALAPGAEYHYRVVATSSQGSAVGPDQVFRTFLVESPSLADGRVYEQVSPIEKNGGEVRPLAPERASCGPECSPGLVGTRFPMQVAPDGNAIAFQSQPFRLDDSPTEYDENLARRTDSGWQTAELGLYSPSFGEPFTSYSLSPNLSTQIVSVMNPALTPGAPPNFANLFTQQTNTPTILTNPVLTAAPPNRTGENNGQIEGATLFRLEYVGASSDFSHIFFTANDALTSVTAVAPAAPDPGPKGRNLYEWSASGLRLVNVSEGNASAVPGATFGAAPLEALQLGNVTNAISSNGSRAFWSNEAGNVFVREDGTTTREIPVAGKFLGASPDGSLVILTTGKIFNLETEEVTDLTEGKGGFLGVVAQTEDLSRLYFVSTAILDETPNQSGAEAQAGSFNLYVWKGGAARFIAQLGEIEAPKGLGYGAWAASAVQRTAQVSPNGRWLAFESELQLTSRANMGFCHQFATGVSSVAPCHEVYLYDSETGHLVCTSCNPVGAFALGPSWVPLLQIGVHNYLRPVQYVTNDGRQYFNSRDSLTVLDRNRGVDDVYQYEPAGVGTCTRAEGCVSLVSSGDESYDSEFAAADSTGKNVFFTTRGRLVPQDTDDLVDLYDAREGGGFPPQPGPPVECQGEACQQASPPPSEAAPGSSVIGGSEKAPEKHKKKHKKHKKKHQKGHKKKHQTKAKKASKQRAQRGKSGGAK